MKTRFLLLISCMFLVALVSSCYSYHSTNNSDGVSVTVSENEEEYKLSASFDENKTRLVQNYVQDFTGNTGLIKSGKIEINANLMPNNNTKFYIKCKSGQLKIRFDREENSEEAYERIQEMCEGIKELLIENE